MSFSTLMGIRDWDFPNSMHERDLTTRFSGISRGSAFLDIGAHVGTWSLRLHKNFEQIFAFEPNPETFGYLKANLRTNKVKNVKVSPLAFSNIEGYVKFVVHENRPASSSMTDDVNAEDPVTSEFMAQTVTLDRWVKDNDISDIDLVKIDTEGAEVEVIEGGIETFRKFRPCCCIETHRLSSVNKVRELLGFLDLELYDKYLKKDWNKYLLHGPPR
jgi:FkbM family methyltransferase